MITDTRLSLLMDQFPTETTLIRETAHRVSSATTKAGLLDILAKEMGHYSIFDLQLIGGRLNNEIRKLPSPYREAIRPYFIEQLFGMHHALLLMSRSVKYCPVSGPLRDPKAFGDFCGIIPDGCFSWDDQSERNLYLRNPKMRLFYYLVSAFTMFVLDQPGHPVGMPFPGGFKVEQRGNDYFCLIRDKEKEVCYSICNFCPAKQAEDTAPV
ncbi:MAG: DUF2115 domain-containing protein [Methanomicrobiales archaeon]